MSEGNWMLFSGVIEGFNHSTQRSQIVRLQPFAVDNAAAPSTEFAYVFDGVIENIVAD